MKRRRKHCWHHPGVSRSTLMLHGNGHDADVRCCHCGIMAVEHSQDESYTPKGHGPHARAERRVVIHVWPVNGTRGPYCAEVRP